MSNKKSIIIMASVSLVLLSILGGITYSSKKVEAREKQEKQILFAKIDKQQEQEEKAKDLKADAPIVIVEPSTNIKEEPKYEVPPPAKKEVPKEVKKETSTPTIATPKEQPKQEVPKKEVTKASQEIGKATTTLSDADIKRLQSYKQYSTIGGQITEAYIPFNKMYTDERADCDALMEKFSALTLGDYNKAKTEWLTSPKLVYCSAIAQYCVRGILSLTYYSESNKFKLTPNVKYQRDVEYRLLNSVSNGRVTLKLESIHYLSDFKAVK